MTEDMLVSHFLIQPDPEGVRLQGWEEIQERAFSESQGRIATSQFNSLATPG